MPTAPFGRSVEADDHVRRRAEQLYGDQHQASAPAPTDRRPVTDWAARAHQAATAPLEEPAAGPVTDPSPAATVETGGWQPEWAKKFGKHRGLYRKPGEEGSADEAPRGSRRGSRRGRTDPAQADQPQSQFAYQEDASVKAQRVGKAGDPRVDQNPLLIPAATGGAKRAGSDRTAEEAAPKPGDGGPKQAGDEEWEPEWSKKFGGLGKRRGKYSKPTSELAGDIELPAGPPDRSTSHVPADRTADSQPRGRNAAVADSSGADGSSTGSLSRAERNKSLADGWVPEWSKKHFVGSRQPRPAPEPSPYVQELQANKPDPPSTASHQPRALKTPNPAKAAATAPVAKAPVVAAAPVAAPAPPVAAAKAPVVAAAPVAAPAPPVAAAKAPVVAAAPVAAPATPVAAAKAPVVAAAPVVAGHRYQAATKAAPAVAPATTAAPVAAPLAAAPAPAVGAAPVAALKPAEASWTTEALVPVPSQAVGGCSSWRHGPFCCEWRTHQEAVRACPVLLTHEHPAGRLHQQQLSQPRLEYPYNDPAARYGVGNPESVLVEKYAASTRSSARLNRLLEEMDVARLEGVPGLNQDWREYMYKERTPVLNRPNSFPRGYR